MFGAEPSAPAAPIGPASAADSEPAQDELSRIDGNTLIARAQEEDDKLDFGARLFLRTQYLAYDEGEYDEDFALSSPNLLDVYMDGRPNDRLRAYVNARLRYDPTVGNVSDDQRDKARVALDQLWLKFDVAQTVFVTAGKQRIKWGRGRFWNPTDFMNQTAIDPLAVIDERLGADLIKLHLPIESLAWNFYAIVDLQRVTYLDDLGAALRAELVLGPAETALTAAVKGEGPLRLGLDVSSPLGPFDVYGELSLTHPYRAGIVQRLEGPFDITARPPVVPIPVDREDEWIPQAVIGLEHQVTYSDDDSVFYGVEYFFNDLGYADSSVYPLLLTPPIDAHPLGTRFQPLYNGRHYVAAFVSLPAPGSWNDHSFSLSSINNLGRLLEGDGGDSQFTGLLQLDYRVTVLTHLSVNASFTYFYGEDGEFRYRFAEGAPTQWFMVGAGLRVEI